MNNANSFIYFCCNGCQVRVLCNDQVTVQQLSQSGIINLGQGCMIKTKNFTLYSHKDMSSDIKISSYITNPGYIPPINHIINFSMTTPIENVNLSETQNELKEIHDKIRILKENQGQVENISYHDIHHYTAIYMVVGVVAVLGGVVVWLSWRGRAPPAPPAAPAPAGRASSTTSDDDQCQCKVQGFRRANSARKNKQDRGTSPFVKKSVFKVCEQTV